MSLLSGLGLQDSQGVDLADYQLVFTPGLTNISGNIFGIIADFLYAPIVFITGIAAWVADLLANPSTVFGGLEDAFTSAVSPVFDIIPVPALAMLAATITVAMIGMKKTSSARETLATDGKRALIGIGAATIVVFLASNPFIIVGGVVNFTSSAIRELFAGWSGTGGSVLMDTFLRPMTQMINFGGVLNDACNSQWTSAVSSGGNLTCVDEDVIKDPTAMQGFTAGLGIIVALVVLVFQVFALALVLYHFVSAMVGSGFVLYAACIAIARRHNFDFLARTAGFVGAHLVMLFMILVVSLAGPGLITAAAGSMQGDQPGSARLLASVVLMPLGYGLLIFVMWKLASRTGKVARFLRIGANRKMHQHYATEGTSTLQAMGLEDATKIPEAATTGKLGTAAAWGLGGTGVMEKMMRQRSTDDPARSQDYADQDDALESPFAPSYPDAGAPGPSETAARDQDYTLAGAEQAYGSDAVAPLFVDSDGEEVTGYDSDREVFDADGEPVTGWETGATGQVVPTTFDADGEPMAPVGEGGRVNEVYGSDGQRILLFPNHQGELGGSPAHPGSEAHRRMPQMPVEAPNNLYGDALAGDGGELDEGYTPDTPRTLELSLDGTPAEQGTGADAPASDSNRDAGDDSSRAAGDEYSAGVDFGEPSPFQPAAQTGVPTTHSTPDITGAGMHGSTITPVPPARFSEPTAPVAGSDHPGFGAYAPQPHASTGVAYSPRLDVGSEVDSLDDIGPPTSAPTAQSGPSGGLFGPDPSAGPAPQTPFANGQPEVENVVIQRTASLRDFLSGAHTDAKVQIDQFEQLAAGESAVVPLDPDDAQMELDLFMEDGTPTMRPSHQVNLDGSIT